MNIRGMVFVGFNRRVAALDRDTGTTLWRWEAPEGRGFVSLLLDNDRLFAAVNGYTYCLDPTNGQQLWFNPMKGFGMGTTSIATVGGNTGHAILGQAAAEQARARGAAAGGGAAGAS